MSTSKPSLASGGSGQTSEQSRSLKDIQLALLSRSVLDIPPHTRLLIAIAGVIGIGLIAMESLVGNQSQTIQMDKIIHFSGYATLALVFVLALRPILFTPVLVGLVGVGLAIEFLQVKTGRMFDLRDAYANGLGVVIGASVGLIIRGIYAYIQKDLAIARVKHKLVCFETGSVILREEEPVQKFYIIKSGTVRATREVNGKPVYLNDVGPGAVVGVISVIQGKPQYSTITSLSPTTLYSMGLDELMDSAGGREQPVSTVLMVMADYLQKAGEIISQLRAEPLAKNEQPPPQRSHFS